MKLLITLALCCLVIAANADEEPTACRLQKKLVSQYGKPGDFMPTCDANGDYAQVQCRQGFCWCAKKDGTQLTKSKKGTPDCSGQPRK